MDDSSPLEGLSSLVQLSGVTVPARARFIGEALVTSTLTSVTLGLSCGMMSSALLLPGGPLVPFLVGSWTGYSLGLIQHWRTCQRTAFHYAHYYPTILAHALSSSGRMAQVPPRVIAASEEALLRERRNEEKERRRQGRRGRPDHGDEDEDDDAVDDENDNGTSRIVVGMSSAADTIIPSSSSSSSSTTFTLEEWIQQGGLGRLSWSILAAQACRADVEDLERQRRQTLMEEHTEKYYGGGE